MASLPIRRNLYDVLNDFKYSFENNLGISDFSADSKLRALVEPLANEAITLREETIYAIESSRLSTATGKDLDEIGNNWGIERLLSRKASSPAKERSVAFLTVSGTFGAINGGADLTIPKGTVLYTDAVVNDNSKVIRFVTTEEAIGSSGSSVVYVSAEAEFSGGMNNIPRRVLKHHNFTGYADAVNESLICTNLSPILNGRDVESDESYRYKISLKYSSLLKVNDDSLFLKSISVPGVASIEILKGYFGIGHNAIVVFGPEGYVADSTLMAVGDRVGYLSSIGSRNTVIAPTVITFNIEIDIADSRYSARQKEAIYNSAMIVLDKYLGQTISTKNIDFKVIAQEVINATGYRPIFKNNGTRAFKKLYKSFSAYDIEELLYDSYIFQKVEYGTMGTLTINYV